MPFAPFATDTARSFAVAAVLALLAMLAFRLGLQHLPPLTLHLALPPLALPHLTMPQAPRNLDLGVVVLFAPLCALVLAMLYVAMRLIVDGALPDDSPPHARAIAHWQDARL